jgi:hypothetical protein
LIRKKINVQKYGIPLFFLGYFNFRLQAKAPGANHGNPKNNDVMLITRMNFSVDSYCKRGFDDIESVLWKAFGCTKLGDL